MPGQRLAGKQGKKEGSISFLKKETKNLCCLGDAVGWNALRIPPSLQRQRGMLNSGHCLSLGGTQD
jgi:hypothetical protein